MIGIVKICGITLIKDAVLAIECGAAAIGFIFHTKSPRYISPEEAKNIVIKLKGRVAFVGVFVDEPFEKVNQISDLVGLDYVQLHGNETPKYCSLISLPVIKAFRVHCKIDLQLISKYNVHAFLFDSYVKGIKGGTGTVFNWELLDNYSLDRPIIISGGLNHNNILDCISKIAADALDISSGIELHPGIKDEKKVKLIFKLINNHDMEINSLNIFKKI